MAQVPIISLWRPWANWVAMGWKKIETREHGRLASLVGRRVGIHAALKWDKDWEVKACAFLTPTQIGQTRMFLNVGGGVICTAFVNAERWLKPEDAPDALIDCTLTLRHGLFLNDVRSIEVVPMKGHQGIWYANLESLSL